MSPRLAFTCMFLCCVVVGSWIYISDRSKATEATLSQQQEVQTEPGDHPEPEFVDARLGQEVGAFGVTFVPLEVLEDSRCPVDVQCIQAGTVRLRAQLMSALGAPEGSAQIFTLGQPITTEAEILTLTEVRPEPRSTRAIIPGDYSFIFEISKR